MAQFFTEREKELLPQVVAMLKANPSTTQDEIKRELKCSSDSSSRLQQEAKRTVVKHECPQCHEQKSFPLGVENCGCTPQGKVIDETKGNVRTVRIDGTRICNEEQLVDALGVDLTVWYIHSFKIRKWEMGYVKKETSNKSKTDRITTREDTASSPVVAAGKNWTKQVTSGGEEDGDKSWTPGHHQLFAVACEMRRIVTAEENDQYVKQNVSLMKEKQRLTMQLAAEKRYRVEYQKNMAGVDEAVAQIHEIARSLGSLEIFGPQIVSAVKPTHQIVKTDHNEDAVLLLSDWHCGDTIRPGDTSGFPEFDLPICGNRIGYVIRKAKSVLTMHRAMYPIKKLYVWFGGDMGNGDLHDAPVSNCLFIGPQVVFTFEMAKLAIDDLVQLTEVNEFGQRVVEEIVILFTCGNHMREAVSKYMPMKYQGQRTFDWVIYQMLISHFSQEKYKGKVSIRQGMSPYIFENIRGHRYGFAHGMQVGYRNDPNVQAKTMGDFIKLTRGLFDSPEFRRKHGIEGASFDRWCIGDIHVPVSFPRLKSNASINGQNELGVNWGLEPIPAGQQLFGVTEKHLESFSYFLECSHIQKNPDDWNSYGQYAAEFEREHGRK